jgi:probable F420-dependent oxidoreductase
MGSNMRLSVVAAAREDDRPPDETLVVATNADQLGYGEVWVGEGPTWDAFALTTAIGLATDRIAITAGPLPVSVRDAATIVRGASAAQALIGRPIGVALGTASKRVVEDIHGRSRAGATSTLEHTAQTIRPLTGRRGSNAGDISRAFRRRLAPPTGPLTVAAFGSRAIAIAAEHADRMLLDVVSPDQVRELRTKLDQAVAQADRAAPSLVAWLPTAVEPDRDSTAQLLRGVAGYLSVRGYREMFLSAGFDRPVE